MKKVGIIQIGVMQVDVSRVFVAEVPDEWSEEQTQEYLDQRGDDIFNEGDTLIAWADDNGQDWIGCKIDQIETIINSPAVWDYDYPGRQLPIKDEE